MLKFYFTTVLIGMVVIHAACKITAKAIQENGWLDNAEYPSEVKNWEYLTMVAVIPVFRLFIVIMAFHMAGTKKKDTCKTNEVSPRKVREMPSPQNLSRKCQSQKEAEETLLKLVKRLSCRDVPDLDAKLLLMLARDRQNKAEILEYIGKFSRRDLSDLDMELVFMLVNEIADGEKGAGNVSG